MLRAVRMPTLPSVTSSLIRGQIVVLDDDHASDAKIFCEKLLHVALVELFKVLILPSSAELMMETH